MARSLDGASSRRVVVTGAGCVTPLGLDRESSWRALLSGESGVRDIRATLLAADDPHDQLTAPLGAPLVGFDLVGGNSAFDIRSIRRQVKTFDQTAQYFLEACHQALVHAGVPLEETLRVDETALDPRRFGVVAGTGIGGAAVVGEVERILSTGKHRIAPSHILRGLVGRIGEVASMTFGAGAFVDGNLAECAAASGAINDGADEIVLGRADVVLAGGAEFALAPTLVGMFDALKAALNTSDDPGTASRPFHLDPGGLVMAQGAGAVVLEEREHALRRGAPLLGELIGWGKSSDAADPVFPDSDGIRRSIEQALEWAGLEPRELESVYLNAHATSTGGDFVELEAIAELFEPAQFAGLNSTKGSTGHMFGAAGAVEATFCLLALRDNVVPPALVKGALSPEAERWPMSFGTPTTPARPIALALNRSSGFGGHNRDQLFAPA